MFGAGAARVRLGDYFTPELGSGAEMFSGDSGQIIAKLIEILRTKGELR
jgi:hypothetical protein